MLDKQEQVGDVPDRGASPSGSAQADTGSAGTGQMTPPRTGPRIARWLASLALVAAVLAAGFAVQRYLVATRPEAPKRVTTERPRPVATVVATPGDIQPMLRLYGQISAGRSVDLRTLVAGEIVAIAPGMIEGGRVAADTALVTIERFEYEGALVKARADLAEARAQIAEIEARVRAEEAARSRASEQSDIAAREVDRLSKLADKGTTSEAVLDTGKSRLSVALAAVEARDNQIQVLKAQRTRLEASVARLTWNVDKAERDVKNTTLRAPYEAIVSNVAAEVGRLVNINDRVATLVALDRMEARFTLSDAQYGRLVTEGEAIQGRPVVVRWQGGVTGIELKGRIDRVSPVVSAATGGFDVYARLERTPSSEVMRPGAFVTVETPDVVYRNVVRLPQSAVHPGGTVFVVGDKGRLSQVPVTVAGYDADQVLVRGNLPAGARLMTSRLPDAGPEVLVQPRDDG